MQKLSELTFSELWKRVINSKSRKKLQKVEKACDIFICSFPILLPAQWQSWRQQPVPKVDLWFLVLEGADLAYYQRICLSVCSVWELPKGPRWGTCLCFVNSELTWGGKIIRQMNHLQLSRAKDYSWSSTTKQWKPVKKIWEIYIFPI